MTVEVLNAEFADAIGLRALFAHFREVAAKLEAEGWRVAAQEPKSPEDVEPFCMVREEPPAK